MVLALEATPSGTSGLINADPLPEEPKTLEPREFCQKYARIKEGQHGYKAHWRKFIAHCCRVSIKTVYEWGAPPDFPELPEEYRYRLAEIDALKAAENILRRHNLHKEFLDTLE